VSAFDIEVFYDGACPLCAREIRMLRGVDRRQRIRFTDIADDRFDAREVGAPLGVLAARIHGRLPDGRMIEGVEVFRRMYAAVGFPRLVAMTRWPVVAPALEIAYGVFARYRRRLTGQCSGGTCAPGRSPEGREAQRT
jgi:predicted DCC family thiol-disulfide oxidoreductase YuxK